MVNISVVLETKTHEIPKAEYGFRMGNAIHILAEMVINSMVEAEEIGKSRTPVRDSEQAPVVLPQESLGHSLPDQNTSIVEA